MTSLVSPTSDMSLNPAIMPFITLAVMSDLLVFFNSFHFLMFLLLIERNFKQKNKHIDFFEYSVSRIKYD